MKGFAFPFNHFFLRYREGHNEGCAPLRDAPYRNLTPMPVNDLFADGKTHAGSSVRGIPSMESLEWLENLVAITLIETYAVVLDHNLAGCTRDFSVNLDDRWLRFFPVLY